MNTENLASNALSILRKEKGNTCISVILPAGRFLKGKGLVKNEVNDALAKVRQLLDDEGREMEIKALMRYADELLETVDFTNNSEGLGLFISSGVKLAIRFPFPVEEKILVADHFELRELMYEASLATPYYILLLSEQGCRLFQGTWNAVSEIKDSHFPMLYTDDYIYAKPAHSSSYAGYAHVKDYERDKSELEAIRLKDFFRHLDAALGTYLVNNTSLVVFGVKKDLSLFVQVSGHLKQVIDKIEGNYNHNTQKELGGLAWRVMQRHFEENAKKMLDLFEEKTGKNLGLSGIQDIWIAAREGKGLKLLVEKDYRRPAFLTENEYHLYLHPPKRIKRALPDAVEMIIETVLEKKGDVCFVENGFLKQHHRIALMLRY
ncbi:hypothetical protein LL912_02680 [Niabella sp. CC-SYL272]|uniref:baeRF3 domain-containing protein n=1 Tax=Niabella agricola TaxID=2891571 RepID=UPI001F231437|nr:hypothetical protein [Niabella agricola]MCF3107677.1 hypothetical protein [Niabella agricola]